jgi:hypothetical protein
MKSYLGDDGIWYSPAQRTAVHAALMRLIDAGEYIPKKVCAKCGQTEGIIDFHHRNYSHPYLFMDELCWRCHMMEHLNYRYPAEYLKYRKAILAGVKFAPVFTRDFANLREHGIV